MRRTPLRRKARLQTHTRIRPRGKRAWRAKKSAGAGTCTYCGWWIEQLTWDHVVPRSLGGADEWPNTVPACWDCNTSREGGWKPRWSCLSAETRRYVLEKKGPIFARRYFVEIEEAA